MGVPKKKQAGSANKETRSRTRGQLREQEKTAKTTPAVAEPEKSAAAKSASNEDGEKEPQQLTDVESIGSSQPSRRTPLRSGSRRASTRSGACGSDRESSRGGHDSDADFIPDSPPTRKQLNLKHFKSSLINLGISVRMQHAKGYFLYFLFSFDHIIAAADLLLLLICSCAYSNFFIHIFYDPGTK